MFVDMFLTAISHLLCGGQSGQDIEPSVLFSTLMGKQEMLRDSHPACGRRKDVESTQPLAGPVPSYTAV